MDFEYAYPFQSVVQTKENHSDVLLANYSEIQKKETPCFFWGKLNNPFILSKCLVALSNTVQSSFNLSTAILKDPIVTAGNEKLRFEGFSHCAGVYVRTDLHGNEIDGEFIENGTTNVDFNQAMISSLGAVSRKSDMLLAVGKKDVQIIADGRKVVEKKVPLPTKWLKGLTTVQYYLSETEEIHTLNKLQAQQLFKTIPKGQIKNNYYLIKRGNRFQFSPLKSMNTIVIGGIHRLHLLTPLLPFVDQLKIYAHKDLQSVSFQLYFGEIVQSYTFSRDFWRGFSGEGALLEELLEDIPNELIQKMDNYSYVNQEFNSIILAMEQDASYSSIHHLTAKLAAMGLLGYELDSNQFFYRRLPFKLSRILTLNPRLKGVEKLLANNQVQIINKTDNRVEARVEGSGVMHSVILGDINRCTCTWFSQNQGERGDCKHILAVKKLAKS